MILQANMKKVIVGIATSGNIYRVGKVYEDRYIGTRIKPSTIQGEFTSQDGHMGYNEICRFLKGNWYIRKWDTATSTPLAVHDKNVISYDDPISVTLKIKTAITFGVAGAMVWTIDTDDFQGDCGEKFPILKAVNKAFGRTAAAEKPRLGELCLLIALLALILINF